MVMLAAPRGNVAIKLYPYGILGWENTPAMTLQVLLSPPHTPHESRYMPDPSTPSHPTALTKKHSINRNQWSCDV